MSSNYTASGSGSYVVELDVYGSTLFTTPRGPTGPNNNSISVAIGVTTVIPSTNPPDGPNVFTQLSGSVVSATGPLTLTHVSPTDYQGLFLSRLQIFDANCN